jgi:hypothetical protein
MLELKFLINAFERSRLKLLYIKTAATIITRKKIVIIQRKIFLKTVFFLLYLFLFS